MAAADRLGASALEAFRRHDRREHRTRKTRCLANVDRPGGARRRPGALLAELPDGLDTVIGDGGRRLSAGQGQRVAIARALLSDASLVVLDEPTANLDADNARDIGAMIARLAMSRTTLLITHDRSLASRAQRVVELAGGRARELEPAPADDGRPAPARVVEVAA